MWWCGECGECGGVLVALWGMGFHGIFLMEMVYGGVLPCDALLFLF